jgi:DNA-binding PadR family transcriptional regulator
MFYTVEQIRILKMNKYLSRPEEVILLVVMKLNDNAYGVSIREMVQELTGKYWSIGAVYVPLERLEKKGYVTSFSSEPLPERGGRRKRHFRITREGIEELEKIRRVNQVIWDYCWPNPLKTL